MQVEKLVVDREEARELYRAYKKHQHYSEPLDDEIRRVYQLIAQGRMVIRALESIKAAGLNEQGYPKLAIVRADAQECFLEMRRDGWARFSIDDRYLRSNETRRFIEMPSGSFANVPNWVSRGHARAMVPLIPIHLRPKRALQNYHILFEAEWERVVPKDPMLLRRIGKGDIWLVAAAWDLTPVERAVLATRLNA